MTVNKASDWLIHNLGTVIVHTIVSAVHLPLISQKKRDYPTGNLRQAVHQFGIPCILQQLFTSVSVKNGKYLPCRFAARQISTVIRGEQGWRSGESARLPPMWSGFDSRSRCHMWVEFVVGSRLCSERFYSGYSCFPLSSKTNISKFQFDPEPEGHRFVSPRLLCVTLVKQS